MRHILDTFQLHYRALESLKQNVSIWSTLLIHIQLNKLDTETIKEWDVYTRSKELKQPKSSDFTSFLTEHCNMLERCDTRNQFIKPSIKNTQINSNLNSNSKKSLIHVASTSSKSN